MSSTAKTLPSPCVPLSLWPRHSAFALCSGVADFEGSVAWDSANTNYVGTYSPIRHAAPALPFTAFHWPPFTCSQVGCRIQVGCLSPFTAFHRGTALQVGVLHAADRAGPEHLRRHRQPSARRPFC